jgi:aminopeptidase-like protein
MPKRMMPDRSGMQEEGFFMPISQIMDILKYFTQMQNTGMWNEQIPPTMAPAHTPNLGSSGYYPSVGSKDDMKQTIMDKFGFTTDEQYNEFQKTDAFKKYRENLYRRSNK